MPIWPRARSSPPACGSRSSRRSRSSRERTGKKFGDPENPLLVSCRSGAKFSMPGMMDTVLNIGLNDETAAGMVKLTGNQRFVYDSYRRLMQMFGSVVLGIADEAFEDALEEYKRKKGVKPDTELTAEDWKALTDEFQEDRRARHKGFDFPQDPIEQLRLATEAVFKSWNGKRAIDYRNAADIPHDLGTAVNIVTMVFGNMGWDSGTGVAFTRNPATGEKKMYGDYLINAQGEDVVAGIRNTEPIDHLGKEMPEAYQQFMEITRHAGEALPGHAGRRVHHRARQAVDAADPQRQAHRQGRGQDRRGYGERRADHQGRSHPARHPRPGGHPAAPAVRRQRQESRQEAKVACSPRA